MLAVEVLNDKKVIQRQDELFLAQSTGVPEHDVLLFSLFDRGELEIPQDRILLRIFGSGHVSSQGKSAF
jgi:3-hydroxy-3-methylglutaryl CoA synthase